MSFFFWIDLIYFIIFALIILFVLTIKFWSSQTRKEIITFILIYCSINAFMVLTNFGIRSGGRRKSRTQECFDNCVRYKINFDDYNMKHNGQIKDFSMEELLKEGHIDKNIFKPSPNCEYVGIGNLEGNGLVCCLYHGIPKLTNRSFFDFNDSAALKRLTENDTENEIEQIKKEIEQAKASVKDDFGESLEKFISYRKNLYIVRVFFFPFTLLPIRAIHLN
jgi:hypothetical protein